MSFFSKAFWRGFSTWFNIWPYHEPIKIKSNEESFKEDLDKIADDWKQVGDDIHISMKRFKKEYPMIIEQSLWTKEHPKQEGYYWVRTKGQLTGKEYIHPVHVYSSKGSNVDTVFSDGENFSIDSDIFIEWYLNQIVKPI